MRYSTLRLYLLSVLGVLAGTSVLALSSVGAPVAAAAVSVAPARTASHAVAPHLIQGGTCNAFSGAAPLGASYHDNKVSIPACGPRPDYGGSEDAVSPYPGALDTPGYQCVELSERYLYYEFGVTMGVSTNGDQIVAHYAAKYPKLFSIIANGTKGQAPVEGDVLSFSDSSDFDSSSGGHTAVVQSSSVNSAGNGSVTIIEENFSANGTRTLSVSGWDVSGGGYDYTEWLHAYSLPGAAPINRGSALIPGTTAGYILNGDGALTPFGGAPAATITGSWPGWDIARAVAILPNGKGGYVLDGYGGVHPFAIGSNAMPPAITGAPYWSGWDIARSLVLNPAGTGGYVLDGYGGVHPFAIGSNKMPAGAAGGPYWSGWDIARDVVLNPAGTGGYVLDGYGGVHPFAIGSSPLPPPVTLTAYWSGWDIARSLVLDSTGEAGYVLDGYGALHPFYAAGEPEPPVTTLSSYTAGVDQFKAVSLYEVSGVADHPGGVSGVTVSADSNTPDSFTAVPAGRAIAYLPGSASAGYRLEGDGTLASFGGAPAASVTGYWPNWDIARAVAILPDGKGGYVLDGYGGVHPFAIGSNPMPPAITGGPYWSGWDIARGLVLNVAGTGGYVLDGYGGIHPFAVGSNKMPAGAAGAAYWKGWDIARGIVLDSAGTGGYTLDGYGGIHPFAIGSNKMPPGVESPYYTPGWDVADGLAIGKTELAVVDSDGGVHDVAS